jgi:hypothetical protein
LKAKLEPYLGFLHALQHGKPSLVCDFMEFYRYLIDDFLIERRTKFHKKDFVAVTDFILHLRMGKRIHLCEFEADKLAEDLNRLFDRKVEIPRIKHGKKQMLDTLICEEAFLLAKFLRGERNSWIPRIPPNLKLKANLRFWKYFSIRKLIGIFHNIINGERYENKRNCRNHLNHFGNNRNRFRSLRWCRSKQI